MKSKKLLFKILLLVSLLVGSFRNTCEARAEDNSTPETYALLVDSRYLDNKAIADELTRYRDNVEANFGVSLIQVSWNSLSTPQQTRDRLKTLWERQKIKGAFLIGWLRFAKFQNASGDLCTLPEYFEDLDSDFGDDNGDEVFDRYDPWGGNARDDAPAKLDIWIAALRPYYGSENDFRRGRDVLNYFQKVNADLEGANTGKYQKRAQVFTSKDWPNQDGLRQSLQDLYGVSAPLTGGYDEAGKARPTSVAEFAQMVAHPYEMTVVFAHSGPSQHVCDLPAYPGNIILPGVLDYPGRALLEDMSINTKVMLLWGCHTLDIEGVNYMNERSLQDSYLLTPKNKVLTLVGNSKSIGLEDLPFLVRSLKTEPLAEAWLPYLNHVYSKPFLHPWLGDRNAWDKEKEHFNWGYIICGNPFTKIG